MATQRIMFQVTVNNNHFQTSPTCSRWKQSPAGAYMALLSATPFGRHHISHFTTRNARASQTGVFGQMGGIGRLKGSGQEGATTTYIRVVTGTEQAGRYHLTKLVYGTIKTYRSYRLCQQANAKLLTAASIMNENNATDQSDTMLYLYIML
ncbi:uncharacterized protein LOC144648399 [Oculina patagonica]